MEPSDDFLLSRLWRVFLEFVEIADLIYDFLLPGGPSVILELSESEDFTSSIFLGSSGFLDWACFACIASGLKVKLPSVALGVDVLNLEMDSLGSVWVLAV